MLETQVHLSQIEIKLQEVIENYQTDFNVNGWQPQTFLEIEVLLF